MPKLNEILGESFKQIPEDLKNKYKDIDLVDSSEYVEKSKFDSTEKQVTDYKSQLKDRDTQLKDLKSKVKDIKDVKELETKIEDLEKALNEANVHNPKTVRALLNLENVKLDGEDFIGLSEQLETLKESDSYLFKSEPEEDKEDDEDEAGFTGTGNIGVGAKTKTNDKSFGEILGEKRAKEMTSTKDIEDKFFN